MRCERTALAALPAPGASSQGRILCYHSVGTPEWGVSDVSPGRFREQIETALEAGYRFAPARELARTGGRPNELAITFDDGLASVAANAAPLLAEYAIPWTLLIVAGWADGEQTWGDGVILRWREIERLAEAGVTIGSHSVTHPNFGRISTEAAREELFQSRATIQSRLGLSPAEFAIPMGQSRDWTPDADRAARDAGYEVVYAQSMNRRAPGTVGRTLITRFDSKQVFRAALAGAFDSWEEWV